MSHHLDTASARADGRVDLADLYVFDGAGARTTVLIMTVNPDAGKSSPSTFRPDAVYEFKVDLDGDAIEDLSYSFTFGEPDAAGSQTVEAHRAVGQAAPLTDDFPYLGRPYLTEAPSLVPLLLGGATATADGAQ